MDVRYNNIFESTRQYFQGVPVNNVNQKTGAEDEAPSQNNQRIENHNPADYLSASQPSTSLTYWMQENEKPRNNESLQPHLPLSGDKETEVFEQQSNLLPPIAALSKATVPNFSPFKSMNKMASWGQFHSKPSIEAASHATPTTAAVTMPYYPLSSQGSASSSSAFYYPANVQASTSKTAHYYHQQQPNNISISHSRTAHFPSSRESSPYPLKSNAHLMNSKQELQPTFSSSSNPIFPSNSGFKLPPSSKPISSYLMPNESVQLASKIIHTSSNNCISKPSMSMSGYNSNQNMYNINSATSQASYQTEMNMRAGSSRHPPLKLNVNTDSGSSGSGLAYSVPKMEPTGFHPPTIQVNPKLTIDITRENSSLFSRKSTPPSMSYVLHEGSKKLPSFPKTALPPVGTGNKKKASSFPIHFPNATPALSERSNAVHQLPFNNDLEQEIWGTKYNSLLKRESPLDLSVKTVRQSADSTAKDEQENSSYSLPGFQTLDCRIRSQISDSYPPITLPSFSYPLNQAESSPSAPISDFPKTSFNPIFNMHVPPHCSGAGGNHERNHWRTNSSHQGVPQQRVNARTNSEFLRTCPRPQQSEVSVKQLQPQHYYEPQHLSLQQTETNIQYRNKNQNYSNRQQRLAHDATPVENLVNNIAAANTFSHSEPVYSNSNESHLSKKRLLPADLVYESKGKSPKVDSWLKTIDQQIEEKFSSYVTSRANKRRSFTPNDPLFNSSNQLLVDKNAESFSKNNTEVRFLQFHEEGTFHDAKASEVSGGCPKQSVNFPSVQESYSQSISRDQQSVVRNYKPVSDYSFKPECSVPQKEGRSCNGVGIEKFDLSHKNKPPAIDAKLSVKRREEQEKTMARPRTKAELKQVESNVEFATPNFQISNDTPSVPSCKTAITQSRTSSSSADVESGESKSEDGVATPPLLSSISPPKLTEEQTDNLLRKKSSSEMDESEDGQNACDACVFDFRESDSECEMPVLERQTLHEMRRERDRRVHSKIALSNENTAPEKVELGEPSCPDSKSKDPFWGETCDSFLEQLTTAPVQKVKKASKKRLKSDSQPVVDSLLNNKNLNQVKKCLGNNEDPMSNKVKEEIFFRDNLGIPKVVVKDFKKEEEKRFTNLKLEKLSPSELKQEIVDLTNIKRELEEKILESSSPSKKTKPFDELRSNRLHLKKLKSKAKSATSQDIGNEENMKRTISLKVRKRRLKRLGSGETEQTISPKIKVRGTMDMPSRLSDSNSNKVDASGSDNSNRRGKHIELSPNSLSHRFSFRETSNKAKNSQPLLLKKVKRKDSSESVLSTESEDSMKKSRSLLLRLDTESSAKHAAIDSSAKRKMLKRRRASSSIGGRPGLRSATGLRSTKSILNVKRQKQLKKKKRKLSSKSLKQTEIVKSQGDVKDKESADTVLEPVHLNKKKFKFKSVRRKFRSSGFDYLRKKKKQMKKPADCDEAKVKKFPAVRAKPESIDDLQIEIKGWVINKGLGESILHRAARLGYPDAVAYCLEVLEIGASVRDNAGYTPLHEASHRGHLAIARMLLMYGADSSASAIGGIRPLHEAAENGHLELVRLLLSYGADPLLATYSGQSPISLAHDESMRNLLEHHLADVRGTSAPKWNLTCLPLYFDDTVSGCDVLSEPPDAFPCSDLDVEVEYSENHLPSTFWLIGEPMSDLWTLWQEVAPILRLKSTDALLKLLGKTNTEILRELGPSDFAMKASNPAIFGAANYKFFNKGQKIVLVKYTEQLKSFLSIEKITISSR